MRAVGWEIFLPLFSLRCVCSPTLKTLYIFRLPEDLIKQDKLRAGIGFRCVAGLRGSSLSRRRPRRLSYCPSDALHFTCAPIPMCVCVRAPENLTAHTNFL